MNVYLATIKNQLGSLTGVAAGLVVHLAPPLIAGALLHHIPSTLPGKSIWTIFLLSTGHNGKDTSNIATMILENRG